MEDCGGGISVAAPRAQLFVSVGNGWSCKELHYHWLMPISRQYRGWKALLVTNFVSRPIGSTRILIFTRLHSLHDIVIVHATREVTFCMHWRRLTGCRGCQCTQRQRVGGCMHPKEKLMYLLFVRCIFAI